jgi:hypothetical protein
MSGQPPAGMGPQSSDPGTPDNVPTPQDDPPAGLSPQRPENPSHPADGGTGPPPDDPLVPVGFGGWFTRVFGVCRRSGRTLWRLHTITAVVTALYWTMIVAVIPNYAELQRAVATGRESFADLATFLASKLGEELVLLAVGAFVWGGAVFVAIRDAAGRPTTAAHGLRFAAQRALPLMGWWLLAGILIGIGMIMLLVPGLYLMVLFYASLLAVVVVERQGIGRCLELSSRRFWPTSGRLLIAGLVYALVGVIASRIGDWPLPGFAGIALGELSRAGLMIPVNVLFTGVAVVTYAELRQHDDGCTTSALGAELSVRSAAIPSAQR